MSIIARLNPQTGKIQKATYIIAKKNDGKTNGLNVKEIAIHNNHIAIKITSSTWPPAIGTNYTRFPDITDDDRIDGTFHMYYEMNTNLTAIVEATILKK